MTVIRLRTAIVRGALALPLLVAAGASVPAHADDRLDRVVYEITELGSLGGTDSSGNSINNRGWVMGTSTLPGDEVMHAALWRKGTLTDLGTLGDSDSNSAVLFLSKSNRIVVGVTETGDIDPLDEIWSCARFFPTETDQVCRGFVWERGEMRELPTHGGTHGFAAGANNRGLVVGWAETTEEDPTCNPEARQFLGFVGAVWDTRHGDRIQELPPLPGTGDSVSTGNAVNDRGQIVGISGICSNAVGGFSARAAVMWDDGEPIDLGNLGAQAWNTPIGINDEGTVVGFANAAGTPGNTFNERPFIWTERGGMRDLGTLPDDTRGQALGINDRGQIVGLSRVTSADNTAVIWVDGKITDLNELAADYDGHLLFAGDINDSGVITGTARSAETGDVVAFVAKPVRR
jgi:probable HAF family extracellular repeat protein